MNRPAPVAEVTRAQPYAVALVDADRHRREALSELLRSSGYLVVAIPGPAWQEDTPGHDRVDAVVLTSPRQRGMLAGPETLPTHVLEPGAVTTSARQELVLRVGVLCRQGRQRRLGAQALRGSLHLEPGTMTLHGPEGVVGLACAEHRLLEVLLAAGGAVVRREQLTRETWGPTAGPSSNSLDSCVRRLRAKLREHGGTVELVTVRGRGYRLAVC